MKKKDQNRELDQMDFLNLGNFTHGGRREGAGRKKGTGTKPKTVVMRVPEALVSDFKQRIERYKKRQEKKK